MPTVELKFTALPAHVRTARLLAASMARRAGVDDALVDEIKLAVGEACARAVGLHQVHGVPDEVVVIMSDDGGRYAVTVRDRGPAGSDPAVESVSDGAGLPGAVDVETFGDPASNGSQAPASIGLAIITGLVDEVTVVAAEPGTHICMAWPLAAPSAPS